MPASEGALRALLAEFGVHPKKSLGQNFMHDPVWLQRVADAAAVSSGDVVLEVGAGAGGLTRVLADRARHVVALEIDSRLLPMLERELTGFTNVTVVEGDVLALNVQPYLALHLVAPESRFAVVANIPYYITGAILRQLLSSAFRPERLVLTVQSEVADRIAAEPDDMSLLAVSVQYYGLPRIVARVPAGAFYPRPEVNSAIVRIDVNSAATRRAEDEKWFFRVARAGFSRKRKQLQNSLAGGLGLTREPVQRALEAAGVDPRRRAETLSVAEWQRVSERLREIPAAQAANELTGG